MRHLTTESLIALAEGRLSMQSKQDVEDHIQSCAICFAEASEWFSLLDCLKLPALENAPGPVVQKCLEIYGISKPVSKLQQVFATVLFDSRVAATAGVRGVADCQQIVFRAADVDVHFRIGGKPRVILGQMLQRQASHYLVGVPVYLSEGDQQIEATLTDALGEFRFGTVPAGNLRFCADLSSCSLIGDLTIQGEIN